MKITRGGRNSIITPPGVSSLFSWWNGAAFNAGVDGNAISSWPAANGGGNNLSQGIGANQPLIRKNFLNGNHGAEFGLDDYMDSSSTPTSGKTWTCLAVISSYPLAATGQLFGDGSSRYWTFTTSTSGGGDMSMSLFEGGTIYGIASFAATTPLLVGWGMDASGMEFFRGKTSQGFTPNATVNSTWNRIGKPTSGSAQCRISEFCLWTRRLAQSEINNLFDNYFKPKFGL